MAAAAAAAPLPLRSPCNRSYVRQYCGSVKVKISLRSSAEKCRNDSAEADEAEEEADEEEEEAEEVAAAVDSAVPPTCVSSVILNSFFLIWR